MVSYMPGDNLTSACHTVVGPELEAWPNRPLASYYNTVERFPMSLESKG